MVRCIQAETDKGTSAEEAASICNISWGKSKQALSAELRDVEHLQAESKVEFAEKEEGARQGFLMVAYNGAAVDRFWGKLVIDVAGMQLKSELPAFREHERTEIVGTINKHWKDDGTLYASGVFHEFTEAGKEVLDLMEDGFPWQASIGVRALKVVEIAPGSKMKVNGKDIDGPADVWTESKVVESSFVALGADDDTVSVPHSQEVHEEHGGDEEEMPFPNEHACRLKPPGNFDRFNRKNCEQKSSGKCIDVIYGIKAGKSEIQALRYPKGTWTEASARSHCSSRGGSFEPAGKNSLEDNEMEWLNEILEGELPGEDSLRQLLTDSGIKDNPLEAMICVFKLLEAHKDFLPDALFSELADKSDACTRWAQPVLELLAQAKELEELKAKQEGEQELERESLLMTEISGLKDQIKEMKRQSWEKEVKAVMHPLRLPGIDKEQATNRLLSMNREDATAILASYQEISKAAGTEGAFGEIGSVGETEQASSPLEQLQALAEEKAKEKGITVQKAWTEVLRDNAELYAEYSDSLIALSQGDDD
jgi:hypothetical protein